MQAYEYLKALIGQTVSSVYIIAFPPLDEEQRSQIDIKVGIVFQESLSQLNVFSIDNSWPPIVNVEEMPSTHFKHFDFEIRMKKWMSEQMTDDVWWEYYDFTNSSLFDKIVNKQIINIEVLYVEGSKEAGLGMKIVFDNDYILLTSIADGTTVETNTFNKHNNQKVFGYLGKIVFKSIRT